jgi:hypothetical protein
LELNPCFTQLVMSSAENAKPLNVEAVESLARRRELIRESLRRAREIQREKDAAAKSLQSLAKDKSIMPQGAVPLVDQANARKRAKGEGSSTPRKKYGLDPDTLECPICAEPFSSPVFQVCSHQISTFPHSRAVSSFQFAFNSSFSRESLTQTPHWMYAIFVYLFRE